MCCQAYFFGGAIGENFETANRLFCIDCFVSTDFRPKQFR